MKKEIIADIGLIACCGLYCGACRSYLKHGCPGCRKNEKAGWCKVRSCCMEGGKVTCADCTLYPDPNGCKKFNNFISKAVGFVLRSDRRACIMQIRERGLKGHAENMAFHKRQTIRP